MDLKWTQTEWDELFKKIGAFSSLWFFLKRIREQVGTGRISFDVYNDDSGVLSNMNVIGLVLGENTDAKGMLYGEFTLSPPNIIIAFYKDSGLGGSDMVLRGQIATANIPDQIDLAEMNSSGMTGTVYINASAADTDVLLVCTPSISSQFDVLNALDELDTDIKSTAVERFATFGNRIDSLLASVESLAGFEMAQYIGSKIRSDSPSIGGGAESVGSNGNISVEYSGIIRDLIDAMNDESVAGAQTVKRASTVITTLDGVSADGDNVGQGTLAVDFFEFAVAGVVTVRCIDDTVGSERFEVALRNRAGATIVADYNLTVKQLFNSLTLGLKNLLISRTIIDSDGGSGIAADFSNWSVTGETESNTNDGRLYGKYIDSTKTLELYRDDDLLETDLVASGSWSGVLPQTLNFSEENGSGINGSVQVDIDPAGDYSDLEVNLQPFYVDDKFYFTVLKVGVSYWNEFFGTLFGAELPSAVSGLDYEVAHRGYSGLTEIDYRVN